MVRITPAPAGNTGQFQVAGMHNKDHPRACGEYTKQQFEIIVLLLHEHGEFI